MDGCPCSFKYLLQILEWIVTQARDMAMADAAVGQAFVSTRAPPLQQPTTGRRAPRGPETGCPRRDPSNAVSDSWSE
ncbi:hypothetical protein AK812_SmicGene9026 [Symbiodinium microadriaticum]|uniref:Uncharacterized protein n=1 Tax=Symbiodinium microadriaticum TaxID=2951 RepID=A0A1Q9EJK4_SYMMI|nr:hypothetical protein AK812_SmicGene9026 [Symbiodinium microadriaticum]